MPPGGPFLLGRRDQVEQDLIVLEARAVAPEVVEPLVIPILPGAEEPALALDAEKDDDGEAAEWPLPRSRREDGPGHFRDTPVPEPLEGARRLRVGHDSIAEFGAQKL